MAYREVVKREITRLNTNPLGWFLSFTFPFLMCLMICFIFGKAIPRDLPLAVFDADNSSISRMFVRNIDTLKSCKVKYRLVSLSEGEEFITKGKIYGFIVIPKNFQKDIYRLKQPKLVFYYNNQRILVGSVISKDINTMLQSMAVGIDAKMRNKHGLPMKEAIKQGNLINVVDHIRSNPYFNYQYFLSVTAFGHILQICILFTSVWAIGTEFKEGKTKEWLKEADESMLIAILGKFTPYFVIFTVLFAIIIFIYFMLFHVPYTGSIIGGLCMTFLFLVTTMFFGIIFMSINGNFRYCLSFSAFYAAMGFAFAGVTFPVMSMPWPAKIYSMISPLNYWSQVIIDQSIRQIPFVYDLKFFIPPLILLFISLILLYRLKALALDENRWFKV